MINKILGILLALVLLAIAGGTVASFVTGKAKPGRSLRAIDPTPDESRALKRNSDLAPFTGLPQIRAATKPDKTKEGDSGTPLALTLWFTYPEDDTAFYEELARKSGVMSSIIVSYFSRHTKAELLKRGEDKIKSDLVALINEELILGKIKALYFTDYVFFE